MKLKTAIIDDEIHAIETLSYDLSENYPGQIELLFSTTDPIEGAKRLRNEMPDLLFLDIEMPSLSGLDLMKIIDDLNIDVVITTAYQEFAIEAVGTKAIAYLLKPIQPEKLELIMNTVFGKKQLKSENTLLKDKISIADINGVELIPLSEIIYFKSDGNYSTLFLTSNRKIVASKTLKYFSGNLPVNRFIRVHKSYLVNVHHIKRYVKTDGGELIMDNNDILPVSRSFRGELLKIIQNYL
jgi:two-component system LytT family response regulator